MAEEKIGKGEARAVGAVSAFFGDLLDEGGGVAAWLGIPGSSFGGATRRERYLRARDAFRDQVAEVKAARPREFTQGRVGGYAGQAVATIPIGLSKWGAQVASAAAQGAANRIGAQESQRGTFADTGDVAVEGLKGAGIGAAAGALGVAAGNAPAVAGAAARGAEKVASSGVGRAAKAVANFVEDVSPIGLHIPGRKLAAKAIDKAKGLGAPPPAAPPQLTLGFDPAGKAAAATSSARAARTAEIASEAAATTARAIGSGVAGATAGKEAEMTLDSIMSAPADGEAVEDDGLDLEHIMGAP
jgi:hypothetical protein